MEEEEEEEEEEGKEKMVSLDDFSTYIEMYHIVDVKVTHPNKI